MQKWVKTSCAGGRHSMPRPLQVDLWPFDLESGVRVTCDGGYLCANFSLPGPLCSRLMPDVRNRQSDVRRASSLNASPLWGRGIIISYRCGWINCLRDVAEWQHIALMIIDHSLHKSLFSDTYGTWECCATANKQRNTTCRPTDCQLTLTSYCQTISSFHLFIYWETTIIIATKEPVNELDKRPLS